MIVKLLTEHHLEFLSFKDAAGETHVNMPHGTLLEISCTGSLM